jgi:hypothetical protein
LFAGTEGSGAYRLSHDMPGWWTITKTGLQDTMVYALAVKDTFIFAGTAGGVFRSSDKGRTWTAVNNGLPNTSVTALAVHDNMLYVGMGGVFRSADDGASWTPVNDGLSELARDVLCFVFNNDDLLMGSWRGGVHALKKNTSRWQAANTGLMVSDTQPSAVVHGLAIVGGDLFAGTRGAGVWRRPLSEIITSTVEMSKEPFMSVSLEQNFPNPFNPVTTIEFTLPVAARATLKVFNLMGEQIAVLLEKQLSAGMHRVQWNAAVWQAECICIGCRQEIMYSARSSF